MNEKVKAAAVTAGIWVCGIIGAGFVAIAYPFHIVRNLERKLVGVRSKMIADYIEKHRIAPESRQVRRHEVRKNILRIRRGEQ